LRENIIVFSRAYETRDARSVMNYRADARIFNSCQNSFSLVIN